MIRVRFGEALPALSVRARKAFQLANQEAQRFNHPAVGTEHLLLGVAKEALSPAARLLARAGWGLNWLRRQVARLNPPGPGDVPTPGTLPYADDLAALVTELLAAAESSGVGPITP